MHPAMHPTMHPTMTLPASEWAARHRLTRVSSLPLTSPESSRSRPAGTAAVRHPGSHGAAPRSMPSEHGRVAEHEGTEEGEEELEPGAQARNCLTGQAG